MFIETVCHIFLINLRNDIPSILLDILNISFPVPLSPIDKPGIQILTSESKTHPPTRVNLTQTVGRFNNVSDPFHNES